LIATSRWPVARAILSFVLFEAAWLGCIAAVGHGKPGWGLAAVAVSVAWQLAISERRRADLLLVAAATSTGLVWDTFLVQSNLVVYAAHAPLTAIAPLWILALWAQLGAVLGEPLRWLHRRLWLAALLGAVGGAASYAAAASLGACAFPDTLRAMTVLSMGWGILMPLLLRLASGVHANACMPTRVPAQ
jgi:hypothetical protein